MVPLPRAGHNNTAIEHRLRGIERGLVDRHAVSGVIEDGYSVESFDMTGNTVAVVTLPASALRLPSPADRPACTSPQLVDVGVITRHAGAGQRL